MRNRKIKLAFSLCLFGFALLGFRRSKKLPTNQQTPVSKAAPQIRDVTVDDVTVKQENLPRKVTDVEAVFKRRRDLVETGCKKYSPNFRAAWKKNSVSGAPHVNFIASLDRKALMCVTLKAGSSSWHDLFWHFREPEAAKSQPFYTRAVKGNEAYYRGLSMQQRRNLSEDNDTVRMVNVRHPFGRLISGWNDKFKKHVYYTILFRAYPMLRNYPSEYGHWNGSGHFMPWKSFMQYVADHGSITGHLDEHFRPILATCHPCKFQFDYIVKAESFAAVSDWLLRSKLKYDTMRRLNTADDDHENDEALKIREMFSQLERRTVEKIRHIYALEMELFGYTFDIDTLTAGGWDD